MSKGRKKPIRRKGQMRRFTLRTINTGPTVGSKAAANTTVLSDYSARGRNLGKDMSYLDAKFPGAGGEGKNEPRLAALRRRAEEIAREMGQEPDRQPLVVHEDRLKRVTLHANAQLSRFWFQREMYQLSLIERSIQYSSMAAAKMIFRNGSVDYPHAETVSSSG